MQYWLFVLCIHNTNNQYCRQTNWISRFNSKILGLNCFGWKCCMSSIIQSLRKRFHILPYSSIFFQSDYHSLFLLGIELILYALLYFFYDQTHMTAGRVKRLLTTPNWRKIENWENQNQHRDQLLKLKLDSLTTLFLSLAFFG